MIRFHLYPGEAGIFVSLGVLPEFWGPQTECPAVPDNGRGEINRDPGPDKEERNEFSPCERLTEEEDPERRDKNRVQVLNEPENQHREARSGVGEGDHRDRGHKADKEKREIELHTVPMKEPSSGSSPPRGAGAC